MAIRILDLNRLKRPQIKTPIKTKIGDGISVATRRHVQVNAAPNESRAKLMSVRCRICKGKHEREINLALLSGEPLRSIAERTGYSKSSLLRHYHKCIPQSFIQARQSRKIDEAEFVAAELSKLVRHGKNILERTENSGDSRTALAAIHELCGIYGIMSKLKPQTNSAANVNILVAPELLALRQEILKAIAPFPEARAAVSQALTAAASSRTSKVPVIESTSVSET